MGMKVNLNTIEDALVLGAEDALKALLVNLWKLSEEGKIIYLVRYPNNAPPIICLSLRSPEQFVNWVFKLTKVLDHLGNQE